MGPLFCTRCKKSKIEADFQPSQLKKLRKGTIVYCRECHNKDIYKYRKVNAVDPHAARKARRKALIAQRPIMSGSIIPIAPDYLMAEGIPSCSTIAD